MEEKFLRVEELKEDINCFRTKTHKNNVCININKALLFLVSPLYLVGKKKTPDLKLKELIAVTLIFSKKQLHNTLTKCQKTIHKIRFNNRLRTYCIGQAVNFMQDHNLLVLFVKRE
jgi:hypothetical protein